MLSKVICAAVILAVATAVVADDKDRVLFQFDRPQAGRQWQTVNDGVMGGRSIGRFKINDDKHFEFFGNLSLKNNGGFASVRARQAKPGLRSGDVIVARVRGDGREYKFNVYTRRNLGGFSFRQSFKTKKGEWIEVRFPMDKFVATWRGRVFRNEKLVPEQVTGVGILLGDKKAGPFRLEVDWIKVASIK